MNETSSPPGKNKSLISVGVIVKAGLIVGFADIIAAFANSYISRGTTPDVILKYIASGVFGREAFSPDNGTAVFMVIAGGAFHFSIAMVWTFIFFWLYPRIKFLSQKKVITGIIYGCVVWAVMNLVILPLSNVPRSASFNPLQAAIGIAILIVMIGVPLSFMAHRYHSRMQ